MERMGGRDGVRRQDHWHLCCNQTLQINPPTARRKARSQPLFPNHSSGKRLGGESCTKFFVPIVDSRIARPRLADKYWGARGVDNRSGRTGLGLPVSPSVIAVLPGYLMGTMGRSGASSPCGDHQT